MLFATGIYLFFSTTKPRPSFFISRSNSTGRYRRGSPIKGRRQEEHGHCASTAVFKSQLNMLTLATLISFLREPQPGVPGACCHQSPGCERQRPWVCLRARGLSVWEWEAWTSEYPGFMWCETGLGILPVTLCHLYSQNVFPCVCANSLNTNLTAWTLS